MSQPTPPTFDYIGQELDVFSKAVRWKAYWGGKLKPYMGRRVLEVGAGIGGTTRVLCTPAYDRWLAIEPDAKMVADLQARQHAGEFAPNIEFRVATVQQLPAEERFDSILYIDVVEHIEDDRAELRAAVPHLAEGGHLIVLSPAYQFLYTPFDAAIGHYRRYTREMIRAITPDGVRLVRAFHLDSVGLLASLGNKVFLRASQPTERQILLWDRVMVPASYLTDWLTGYRLGRSVIGVWQKT
jgi:2-polyprenyl-3-methyl-5-hydroxy-6-metoxy-1,4-benzoquinol methylase